jgi:hypothetical protein
LNSLQGFAPTPAKGSYDLFVSYARRDERYLQELAEHLKGLKRTIEFTAFIDKEELRSGDLLRPKIDNALRACSIFIIVATPYYFSSDWALPKEFPAIRSTVEGSDTKKLITLVYEECDFYLEYYRLTRYLMMDLSRSRRRNYNPFMSDLYALISATRK